MKLKSRLVKLIRPTLHAHISSFSRWSLKLRLRSPRGSYSGLNAPPKPLASSSRLSSLSGASGFSGSSPSNQTETKGVFGLSGTPTRLG
ncbi:hypothetical protein YC2023_009923 [Brassica napus]